MVTSRGKAKTPPHLLALYFFLFFAGHPLVFIPFRDEKVVKVGTAYSLFDHSNVKILLAQKCFKNSGFAKKGWVKAQVLSIWWFSIYLINVLSLSHPPHFFTVFQSWYILICRWSLFFFLHLLQTVIYLKYLFLIFFNDFPVTATENFRLSEMYSIITCCLQSAICNYIVRNLSGRKMC